MTETDQIPRPAVAHPINDALSILPRGPKLMEFITHPAKVSACMGPFGSGKTTAVFLKKLLCSIRVPPSPLDGVRYAKTGIVRDTYRNLELNTIPSWEERFPRELGEWRGGGNGEPARARLRFALQDGTELDWQIEFNAIGDHNVKEFCDGLQWTNAAIDGVDAMPPELLQSFLPMRIGRFPPPKHRPDNWKDFVADACKVSGVMNAPDMDNYTYVDFIETPRPGWKLIVQPGGMDAGAENIENLPDGYYEDTVKSMNEWDANRFVHNRFGYSRSGKPVYPEYNDDLHVAKTDIKFDPNRTLHVGIDGGRDACGVFGQRGLTRRLDVLDELVPVERTDAIAFGKLVRYFIDTHYPDARDILLHPDPATDNPNDLMGDKAVWLDLFLQGAEFSRKDVDIPETNAFTARRGAVAVSLTELEEGKPMFRMNGRCRHLRRGFMSGYRYEVIENRMGEKSTKQLPVADSPSTHPHDALQYLALGSLGYRALKTGKGRARRTTREDNDFDPHEF